MASQVVGNYRFLLKHLKSIPSGGNWKRPVLDRFKEGRLETDAARIEYLRAMANQYVTMVRSVNELKVLRALDYGEKLSPRDKIRATASRVGLSVPRFADDALPVADPMQARDERKFSGKA